ncbi:MAG TPA: hypothetical protein DD649_06110 [Providencia sp.]|uniref:GIY-YIG nuclease family protein n=1 Tax=Providencia sp. TaxID=589 RepID=UPI000E9CC28D|nr:GIY-YIG nuclease family protein [Providencia sp.]HBO22449.1 hypothetical protein [Providencia sp.]
MSIGHLGGMNVSRDIRKTADLPDNFRTEGWVYVLSNEYMPGIYKVGMTTVSPESRAKELSSATGVPDKFKIEASFYSDAPADDESFIHKHLSEFRINESREFFKCDLEDITDICSEVCLALTGTKVEDLADSFDIICSESLKELRLDELFDSLDIRVLGCKLATAERLIRLAAHLCHKKFNESHSLYFADGAAHLIHSYIGQQRKEWELKYPDLAKITEVPF